MELRKMMKISIVFLLLLNVIQFGYASSARCLRFDGKIIHEEYDPTYKICCDQMLSMRTTHAECCNGKKIYFTDTQICCNGKVSNKTVSRQSMKWEKACEKENSDCVETACCGNDLIIKEDDVMCCGGKKVHPTPEQIKFKDFMKCCGNDEVYNTQSQMCCGGVLNIDANIGCCANNIYMKKTYRCLFDKQIRKTGGFCGGKDDDDVYDKLKHTCCDDRLIQNLPELKKNANGAYVRNPNATCCGSSVIGEDKKCCEHHRYNFPTHPIPNKSDLDCCGLGYYNEKSQSCIHGIAVDRSHGQIQCGDVLINTTTQDCCANKLPYDNKTQKCCEGAHYCVIGKDDECCNGRKMHSNEMCCENVKPCKKKYSDDDSCCFDFENENGMTFKKEEGFCNRGQFMAVPRGSEPCGPRGNYDPKEYFCCNDKKYKHGDGQCCFGRYSEISRDQGSCCNIDYRAYRLNDSTNPCIKECNKKKGLYYDESTEICCHGRVYAYTGHNYCCGPYAIDSSSRMRCCGDHSPYKKSLWKDCCRNTQLYNPKHSICTDDGKLTSIGTRKRLTDVQKLCDPLSLKLFDGAVQQRCLRKYAITGKVTRVDSSWSVGKSKRDFQLSLSLKKVKSLTDTDFPTKRVTFHIRIATRHCGIGHIANLKKKRVIVMFDNDVVDNEVDISNMSPFFLSPKTLKRTHSVTKAISKNLCKLFS